jgi:plasmid stabilization system protein ParE
VDFQIRITQAAIEDFEEILDYSWTNFPGTAEGFGNTLLNYVDLLRRFPRLGSRIRNRDIRLLVHFPIRIYYRVHEDNHLIEVLHFWHGSRGDPLL